MLDGSADKLKKCVLAAYENIIHTHIEKCVQPFSDGEVLVVTAALTIYIILYLRPAPRSHDMHFISNFHVVFTPTTIQLSSQLARSDGLIKSCAIYKLAHSKGTHTG